MSLRDVQGPQRKIGSIQEPEQNLKPHAGSSQTLLKQAWTVQEFYQQPEHRHNQQFLNRMLNNNQETSRRHHFILSVSVRYTEGRHRVL